MSVYGAVSTCQQLIRAQFGSSSLVCPGHALFSTHCPAHLIHQQCICVHEQSDLIKTQVDQHPHRDRSHMHANELWCLRRSVLWRAVLPVFSRATCAAVCALCLLPVPGHALAPAVASGSCLSSFPPQLMLCFCNRYAAFHTLSTATLNVDHLQHVFRQVTYLQGGTVQPAFGWLQGQLPSQPGRCSGRQNHHQPSAGADSSGDSSYRGADPRSRPRGCFLGPWGGHREDL
jgi:hypothetical protein